MLPALVYTFGPSLLSLTALKLVCDVMLMLQPQIMGLLIDFVEVKYFVDNCKEQGEGYEDCETDQGRNSIDNCRIPIGTT